MEVSASYTTFTHSATRFKLTTSNVKSMQMYINVHFGLSCSKLSWSRLTMQVFTFLLTSPLAGAFRDVEVSELVSFLKGCALDHKLFCLNLSNDFLFLPD